MLVPQAVKHCEQINGAFMYSDGESFPEDSFRSVEASQCHQGNSLLDGCAEGADHRQDQAEDRGASRSSRIETGWPERGRVLAPSVV